MPEVVVIRRRTEPEIEAAIGRLTAAGLTAQAADKVARHPSWGPVILGPGVVVSLFALPAGQDVAVAS